MTKKVKIDTDGLLLGLLTILFVGLKLTKTIDWSWFWVLTPLWGPLALFVFIWALAFVVVSVRGK